jgi:hypothetical protein
MALVVDLDIASPDELDKCDQSTRLEPGWYRAIVNEVYEDHEQTGKFVLKFKLTKPTRFAGRDVMEWLEHPSLGTDEKGAETRKKRFLGWLKRLGLITAEMIASGNIAPNLEDALGREVVLFLIHKAKRVEWINPANGKKEWKDDPDHPGYSNVDFMGVFPLDHYEIPDDLRGTANLDLPLAVVPPDVAAARARAAARAESKGAVGKTGRAPRKTTAKAASGDSAGMAGTGTAATQSAAPAVSQPAAATTGVKPAAPPVQHDFSDL